MQGFGCPELRGETSLCSDGALYLAGANSAERCRYGQIYLACYIGRGPLSILRMYVAAVRPGRGDGGGRGGLGRQREEEGRQREEEGRQGEDEGRTRRALGGVVRLCKETHVRR